MKTKIIFCILFILSMSTIYSQRPIKIEVSNCFFSDQYIIGADIDGCQCFDRVNGTDRIAIWIQENVPDNRAFVFESGKSCAQGAPVVLESCITTNVSDYCHIVDSHGMTDCNTCIVTVLDREPCLEDLTLNNIIIPSDTYKSTQTISSNGKVDVNTDVTFKSNEISLNPNFEVVRPAIFEALIEPDECANYICPPIEDSPTFVNAIPDTVLTANFCEAYIQLPFQTNYSIANQLSASNYVLIDLLWPNNSLLDINVESTNDSISDFTINGLLPIGTHIVHIEVEDQNCNLSASIQFHVEVIDTSSATIVCPADEVLLLNQNCSSPISNFISQVSILNTCTSDISFQDIQQSPPPGTVVSGLSSNFITMTATNYDGATSICQFTLDVVDVVAPDIICPANGTITMPIDANCQSFIPDARAGIDNCDVLVLAATDGAGPRIYQDPRPGSPWVGETDLLIVAVDASGNRDSCIVDIERSCLSPEQAPEFLQTVPDLSVMGDGNCEVTISIPFSIQYCLPENLSVHLDITGPNSSMADVQANITSMNGSDVNYTVTGTMPFGQHMIALTVEDQLCNLSATQSFTISNSDPGLPATFTCLWLVKSIEDSGTVALQASEIVDQQYDCYPSSTQIISSFSADPSDNVTVFSCDDIGGQQMTVFTWDVLDVDNNGVLDTVFKQPCITIQTIIDPGDYCDE